MKIIASIDLDQLSDDELEYRQQLESLCAKAHCPEYQEDDQLVFRITKDRYNAAETAGLRLQTLQRVLNATDISNFFVVIETTNDQISKEIEYITEKISTDSVPIKFKMIPGSFQRTTITKKNQYRNYQYGSTAPTHVSLSELDERQNFLLTKSKVFCIYPWTHIHAHPTGTAWPCCYAEMEPGPLGSCKEKTLRELWNSEKMKEIRKDMLSEKPNSYCSKCYEQEQAGFFSGRQSANKHKGHYINRVSETKPDGTYDDFNMIYWDIRFNNLCNLRCRSCGHIFSSQWYQDQVKLAGPEWAKTNKVLTFSGRTEIDMWEQLLPHFNHVEEIYFAGGEPLLMDEHYKILEELVRRELFHVRLVYNTNFTETRLKDRSVFDYWKMFDMVSVGASLDGMGAHAEYIRKGTVWDQVVRNRESMLEICPQVDFYASCTVSILNAWHVSDFHRDWVDRGLLKAQDFNVNILQHPPYLRVDVAPIKYKQRIRIKWEEHIDWLRPLDKLQRATRGFESAINFLMSNDNTDLLELFWHKARQLDDIRKENLLDAIPELKCLLDANTNP